MSSSTLEESKLFPSIANKVNLTEVIINGSKIGNERTGYKVPFEPAFAIIAAIIVAETAIPIFPKIKASINNNKFLITNSSKSNEYKKVMIIFIAKTKIKLKSSLPVKIVEGAAISWSVKDVPLSSSETNALDKPDMAVKNITTQNNPPVKAGEILSFPIENKITLNATRINIARELTAYLVRNSELKSF